MNHLARLRSVILGRFRPLHLFNILTCVNSRLVTYVLLALTTSRHCKCLIIQSHYQCGPVRLALCSGCVCHPYWMSIFILGIFIDDHTCRSPLSHGLFSNDSIHSFFLIVVLAYVSMYIFKASSALSDAWRLRPLWKSCLSRRTDSMPLVDNIRCRS